MYSPGILNGDLLGDDLYRNELLSISKSMEIIYFVDVHAQRPLPSQVTPYRGSPGGGGGGGFQAVRTPPLPHPHPLDDY